MTRDPSSLAVRQLEEKQNSSNKYLLLLLAITKDPEWQSDETGVPAVFQQNDRCKALLLFLFLF